MRPGRYYQLKETFAPAGFMIPHGQWRLEVVSGAFPLGSTLSITPIGGMLPAINPDGTALNTYRITNWLDFELPLTGGTGTRMIAYSSVAVISIGVGLLMLVSRKKHKTESYTDSNQKPLRP